jgi:hypothetical protein
LQHVSTESTTQAHLAALALLDPKVDATILGVMGTIPEDLLGSLILSVAVNSKPGVGIVGEVAIVIDAKASGAGTIGDGSGVRTSQANGGNLVLDNVKALEASGSLRLGGERDGAVFAASTD